MKKLQLEKIVELDTLYDELEAIRLQCHCDYELQEQGMQVNGLITIEGSAYHQHLLKSFQEQVVLDLFVSKDKLNHDHFQIDLEQYHAKLVNQELHLQLFFVINGMKDEQESKEESYFEDLLEQEDDTYICSVMAVVKKEDTYATLAHRYQVNEASLREYNHHKILEEKMLVRIPIEK